MNTRAGRVGAHEQAHPATAFGGQLQPSGFDLGEMLNERDGRADSPASQAFGQGPQLVRTVDAAEQDEASKIDPCRRQAREVKLTTGVIPGDEAAVLLRRPGEQQRDGSRERGLSGPEQLMHRTALKRAARSHFVEHG
ncbi:MAG TPA: hypothetical protein VG269_29500 [Tepidisphaeraceae bacterium]|jgi:hypothetical protein|nr:hypothetical protein [Tepidisphaeraceae bacterium]